jgi:hypothetical protein
MSRDWINSACMQMRNASTLDLKFWQIVRTPFSIFNYSLLTLHERLHTRRRVSGNSSLWSNIHISLIQTSIALVTGTDHFVDQWLRYISLECGSGAPRVLVWPISISSLSCCKQLPCRTLVWSPTWCTKFLFFLNRCTRQSAADSDDTRGWGCIYTITT